MPGPPREQAFADPWRKLGVEGTSRSGVPTDDGDEVAAQQPLSIGSTVHLRPTADIAVYEERTRELQPL